MVALSSPHNQRDRVRKKYEQHSREESSAHFARNTTPQGASSRTSVRLYKAMVWRKRDGRWQWVEVDRAPLRGLNAGGWHTSLATKIPAELLLLSSTPLLVRSSLISAPSKPHTAMLTGPSFGCGSYAT